DLTKANSVRRILRLPHRQRRKFGIALPPVAMKGRYSNFQRISKRVVKPNVQNSTFGILEIFENRMTTQNNETAEHNSEIEPIAINAKPEEMFDELHRRCEAFRDLTRKGEALKLALGRLLHMIKATQAYKVRGYRSFEQMLQQEVVAKYGISRS